MTTLFLVVAILAIVTQAFIIFLALFGPGLRYKIAVSRSGPLESEAFLGMLEALCDAKIHRASRVEVLTNGEVFYPAQLEAIRQAQRSVDLEAYIFKPGEVTRQFVEALTERARAGVKVSLVLDAIGSFSATRWFFRELLEAGGRAEFYHPLNWHSWPRFNNRTHRELLIVDGKVGFTGGAGFADWWLTRDGRSPRWRDTMVRVEGDAVNSLQATFVENWLEASGEVLAGEEYFPFHSVPGQGAMMVVNSSPSVGLSTRARILFQTLLASAQKTIHITTPYFVPDWSARQEMTRAIRERAVEVTIVVPGKRTDIPLTRRSSRRLYGELLKAGARIFEYEPAMSHTKCLIVDRLWSVVGSTNFDNRSFGLNDEVNLAVLDRGLAARLEEDFQRDIENSREITYQDWRRRPAWERIGETVGWVLERQQ